MQKPWLDVKQVAPLFGITYETAKNKIALGTFPVPTYKLGRRLVADREVVDAYFARRREEGFAALGSTGG